MTAEELWRTKGIDAEYEAWSFGDAPDKLADLVKRGIKTATCSVLALYEAEGERIPEEGDYSVILDSRDEAVCVIRTVKVSIVPFKDVSADHARKEGEGDLSLEYWRKVHEEFAKKELSDIGMAFDEDVKLVLEEFELV